jgi:O-antigen/teichoic acid export membrane protein
LTAPKATATQTLEVPLDRPEVSAPPSGVRSGALLAVASGASIVVNYAFLLAAGRILGSEDYGSLAALLGVLAVVLIPAGALQMAVSREISRSVAAGKSQLADAFSRRILRLALLGTIPLVVIALALAAPLSAVLKIDSTAIVALAETSFVTALLFPVTMGVLQGRQRFHALAVMYLAPFLIRLVLLAILVAAGYRLGGAVFATVASSIAGTILALALMQRSLRRPFRPGSAELGTFLRYLGPVSIGLIGIALLTHVDVLVVKARFSGDDAGAYAAASAFARIGFFLPTTILAVLFPRTAARHAKGEETEDILGRALLATAAFCAALALFYKAAGVGLVVGTFGQDFAVGGKVLAPFALAIGLFSLANIFVGYELSRGETRYAWIVGGGVIIQVAVLALVPTSLRGVVWSNVIIGVALIATHELAIGSSLPAIRAGLRHVRGATAVVRRGIPEAALVLLGTTAFVCAFFWPVVLHLGSTIIGRPGSDASAAIAGIWQDRHESGFHLLGSTHHTLTGAPFGWDETNARNVQVMLAYYPTYLVAHVVGDVAAFNLITLAGYVLSGASMYALVRYLGCARPVAAWAALVMIVFPWHIARAEHASLLQVEVLVLLVLTLVAVARRPSWLGVTLVGFVNLACWLMSGYFGPMAFVTTAAFAVGAAFSMNRRRAVFVLGSTASALAAAAIVGLAAIASNTNAGVGLERSAGDLSIYGLRPLELVVPPVGNLILGNKLNSFWGDRHGSNLTETANYLGLLTIALAVAWLVVAWRRWSTLRPAARLATGGLVAAFVAGLLFASPSPILVFGHKVWMPSRLLWEVIPAFRVPSRWDALLMTALVPLAALGLQTVWRGLAPPRRGPLLAAAAVGAAMVLSFLELTLREPEHFRTVPVPPEYSALEQTPRGILAEYPLGTSDVFRMWQRAHGRPLFNGSPSETQGDYVRHILLDPAAPGTAQALSLLGVTAIGIHPGAHVDAEAPFHDPARAKGYRLIGRFHDGASIWQVIANPAGAIVSPTGGFANPKEAPQGFVGHALVSPAGVGVLDIVAKVGGVVRLAFDAVAPKHDKRSLRIADAEREQAFTVQGRVHLSVLVEIPRGESQLLVKTDPAATSQDDAILLSDPRAKKASGEPALHATLVSLNPGF